MRWNRLFWAFALSFMPSVLLFMGGLSTLQTAAIVGGLPLIPISVMLMISTIKAASLDLSHQDGYEDPVINIEDLPDVDPWSTEGMALAKFEELKATAIEAANDEREALKAIWKIKKTIRTGSLEYGNNGLELGEVPRELQDELERLTTEAMAAKEVKLAASEEAQQARIVFNDLLKEKEEAQEEATVTEIKIEQEKSAAS